MITRTSVGDLRRRRNRYGAGVERTKSTIAAASSRAGVLLQEVPGVR